jgi:flagellar motor component MotA
MDIRIPLLIFVCSIIILVISGHTENRLTQELGMEINKWKIKELSKQRNIALAFFIIGSIGAAVGVIGTFIIIFQ